MFYPKFAPLIAALLLFFGDLVAVSASSPVAPRKSPARRRSTISTRRTLHSSKLKSTRSINSGAPFIARGGGPVATSASITASKTISISTQTAVLCGCALAFNSGFINGACLSGILSSDSTKQAAAAVTGAWTNSALGVASGNYDQAKFNAKCLGSYFSGSLVASLINPNPVPFEVGGADKVSPAFLIGSLLMYASSSVAKKSGGSDTSFIYLAAVACGIQNSITSVLTQNLVRSAHFSGITSDIGTFLGQALRGNKQNVEKLRVFTLLAASFWIGGLVSFSATTTYASSTLLFSSALFLAFAIGGLVVAC
uniref:DUF1275 domain-containing protein n=1 Tax=Minutocellus polymorphus TaxID=265543 RepID=A0A7S0ASH8_9STRA|mmetsp:Transcript_2837/g.4797  ORF Transcript_2837/g.4797 Transcript_2837/m.4797 type:complete len:311 (+) Transcript_2837:87-1019(+)